MDNPVNFLATAQDEEGNALSGATISVTTVSSGLPTTIFKDLAETSLTNPFSTVADGKIEFYCENQVVNVTATKNGFTTIWLNVHLNASASKVDILNNSNLYEGANSYTQPQNFQNTINVKDLNFSNGGGGFVETSDYLAGSTTMQVNGVQLLNTLTLSNANNIVDDDRAVTNIGWWAIAQQNLGTAAFDDKTSPSATLYDTGNLNTNVWDCNASGDFIFDCLGYSTTTAIGFILGLNNADNTNVPTSFALTDSFIAVNTRTGATDATVTSANLTLLSPSTSRTALFEISGLTGLTAGDNYIFRSDTATTKLEVI